MVRAAVRVVVMEEAVMAFTLLSNPLLFLLFDIFIVFVVFIVFVIFVVFVVIVILVCFTLM